jgi:hypothetical protein
MLHLLFQAFVQRTDVGCGWVLMLCYSRQVKCGFWLANKGDVCAASMLFEVFLLWVVSFLINWLNLPSLVFLLEVYCTIWFYCYCTPIKHQA